MRVVVVEELGVVDEELDVVVVVVEGGTVLVVVVVGGVPVEITRLTTVPGATEVLAGGLVDTTTPAGYCVDDSRVGEDPTLRPALPIALPACDWLSPLTFGTDTLGRPEETMRVTVPPSLTLVPAFGLVLITVPYATVVLDLVTTVD